MIRLESTPQDPNLVVVPVLANAPGGKRPTSIQIDDRVPFISASPESGMVDLSGHGVMPVQRQDLVTLKRVLRDFILGRQLESPLLDPSAVRAANVLVLRQGIASQYFLYMTTIVEKGQTCPLRFPTLASLLRSERYEESTYRTRLLIEDALSVLAQGDLGDVLMWLEQDVFDAGDVKRIKDESDGLRPQVCEQRRRLHWASRRTAGRLKKLSEDSKKVEQVLCFGSHVLTKDSLGEASTLELKQIFSVQVKEELLASVENDSVCGTHMRSKWCQFALDMFETFLNEIAACYSLPVEGCAEKFFEKMKLAFNPFMQVEEKKETQRQKTLQRELEWINMSPKGRHAKSKARIKSYETMITEQPEMVP